MYGANNMDAIIYIPLVLFTVAYFTWGMYLAVMNLIQAKNTIHELTWQAKLFAYPLAVCGIIMDFLTNVVVGTIIFLDVPREWLLTQRLQRYLENMDNFYTDSSKEPPSKLNRWRWDAALWICTHLLDPFDSRGYHCRKPKESKE